MIDKKEKAMPLKVSHLGMLSTDVLHRAVFWICPSLPPSVIFTAKMYISLRRTERGVKKLYINMSSRLQYIFSLILLHLSVMSHSRCGKSTVEVNITEKEAAREDQIMTILERCDSFKRNPT